MAKRKNVRRTSRKKNTAKDPKQQIIGFIILFFITVGYWYFFTDHDQFQQQVPPPVAVTPAGDTSNDTVTLISVGQADSSLIASGGAFCLIDAGQTSTGHEDVVDYLNKVGVKEIELLVITHFHTDHTSEILRVMENFKIKGILIPNLAQKTMPTTKFFTKFMDRVEQDKIPLYPAKQGDTYPIGNGVLQVVDNTINDQGINDTSVATLFTQGDFSFLNTGDGENKYEKQLATKLTQSVTLFKSGHHGSKTSNTTELLSVIKPKMIGISAGKNNDYGHPHEVAMERMRASKAQIDITFEKGNLIYSIDKKELIQ